MDLLNTAKAGRELSGNAFLRLSVVYPLLKEVVALKERVSLLQQWHMLLLFLSVFGAPMTSGFLKYIVPFPDFFASHTNFLVLFYAAAVFIPVWAVSVIIANTRYRAKFNSKKEELLTESQRDSAETFWTVISFIQKFEPNSVKAVKKYFPENLKSQFAK